MYLQEDGEEDYLFSWNHGLAVFIIGIIAFCVDCSFVALFPHFSMPRNVSARSKWGLAFAGDLQELQRLQNQDWDEEARLNKYDLLPITQNFRDQDARRSHGTCAMFAMANRHDRVVEWLETQGAVRHVEYADKIMAVRKYIDEEYDQWIN